MPPEIYKIPASLLELLAHPRLVSIISNGPKYPSGPYLKGEITPQVGAVYPVSKIGEAHALLESGKSIGKITVVWE